MELRKWVVLLQFYVLAVVFAEYHGVSFLFPTDGLTLNHEDTINVTYTSSFATPLLYTFCRNSTDNNVITERRDKVPPFNGTQPILLSYLNISSCYWDLRPNTSYGYGANSPSINILSSARAVPFVVGLSSTNVTATASGVGGIGTETGEASSDGTPSSSPSEGGGDGNRGSGNGGLSTGAKAGTAVGVIIGVLIISLIAGFFILKNRRKKRTTAIASKETSNWEMMGREGRDEGLVYTRVSGAGQRQKPIELLSEDGVHEMESPVARVELDGRGDWGGGNLKARG